MGSIKIENRKLEIDMPLDYAVFQLTPTRTRCELLVAIDGHEQKLTSGLIEPFSNHLKSLNDQIMDGNYVVKLQAAEDASWFTKGTMERFLKFVHAPELLECAFILEQELSQLDETLQNYFSENAGRSGAGSSDSELESLTATGVDSDADKMQHGDTDTVTSVHLQDGDTDATDTTTRPLLPRALENRRQLLQNEQYVALVRAKASGFTLETLQALRSFASQFGASRLEQACDKYVALYAKKRGEPGTPPSTPSPEVQEPQTSSSPVRDPTNKENDTRLNDEDITDRRLSVQEKITLFERSMGNINDDGRRSTDIGDKSTSEKPVLRRWSLAHEKLLGREDNSLVYVGRQKDAGCISEEGSDTDTGKRDRECTPGTGEYTDKDVESHSPDGERIEENVPAVSYEAERLDVPSPENKSGVEKLSPLKVMEGADEDKRSVASDTQSLNESKGRLYDKYRQKRDAKLREEGVSGRAERQARLKTMQETLERRRAEISKGAKKSNPYVEAQMRAAKLRAFKAEMLELKKEKEEDERKRLEALRLQRQKRGPVQSPRSPHSASTTPRPSTTPKSGFLPSFQKASTNSRSVQGSALQKLPNKNQKNSNAASSQSVPSASEFRRLSAKPAGISRPDNSGKANSRVLRKSVSSLNETKTDQLKLSKHDHEDAPGNQLRSQSFKVPSSTEACSLSGIRARVTSEEDDVFEDEPENDDHHEDGEDVSADYQAPVAPVSTLVMQNA